MCANRVTAVPLSPLTIFGGVQKFPVAFPKNYIIIRFSFKRGPETFALLAHFTKSLATSKKQKQKQKQNKTKQKKKRVFL